MTILIAYDGSEWADEALEDLSAAGLPAEADVMVVSIPASSVPLPTSCYASSEAQAIPSVFTTVRHARVLAADALDDASRFASHARKQIQKRFPKWDVACDTTPGIPHDVIVDKAREWEADLIVVGSHGRSALVRLFTGSVAMHVVRNAPCSVRVARGHEDAESPARIVIGIDSSPGSSLALSAVADRCWPAGCKARLVMAVDSALSRAMMMLGASSVDDVYDSAQRVAKRAAGELGEAGLECETALHRGDPQHVLLEEAHGFNATCIFVGSRGLSRFQSCLLGSVSSSVVSHANCSVEVVRSSSR